MCADITDSLDSLSLSLSLNIYIYIYIYIYIRLYRSLHWASPLYSIQCPLRADLNVSFYSFPNKGVSMCRSAKENIAYELCFFFANNTFYVFFVLDYFLDER